MQSNQRCHAMMIMRRRQTLTKLTVAQRNDWAKQIIQAIPDYIEVPELVWGSLDYAPAGDLPDAYDEEEAFNALMTDMYQRVSVMLAEPTIPTKLLRDKVIDDSKG